MSKIKLAGGTIVAVALIAWLGFEFHKGYEPKPIDRKSVV